MLFDGVITRVLNSEAIYGAIPPERAIELTRVAFERHHRGEWEMPAKLYVDAPPMATSAQCRPAVAATRP